MRALVNLPDREFGRFLRSFRWRRFWAVVLPGFAVWMGFVWVVTR